MTSFLLGFAFPSLTDLVKSRGFFNWILAALLLYVAGAALKRLPLSYRLTYSGTPAKPLPFFIFLMVGHWFIILFLVIMAEPAFRAALGLPPPTVDNTLSRGLVISALAMATIVTWLVYGPKKIRKGKTNYSAGFLFRMELVADILLTAGVSIFSFVFWEKGVMSMMTKVPSGSFAEVGFLFIFLAILFLFCYMPLRYLFFIEDRDRGRNTRRLLLIFGFLLVKAVLELLGI